MGQNISTKKVWKSTSGWRGQEQFINAVAGANDTGSFEDSPCPSSLRKKEIGEFCKMLKQSGIRYVTAWGKSSNCFMSVRYVLVAPEDHERAYEIAKEHEKETRLFYACEKN
jgi:hypothetical protein